MIRTVAVICTAILVCSIDDRNTAAATTSNEMVMGAVRASSEFSQLVSQQNHSDLSLTALDDAIKRLYQNKGIVRKSKMLMSMLAIAHDLLARESHQFRKHEIRMIRPAMNPIVYWSEKDSTIHCRQCQVWLSTARYAARNWWDVQGRKEIERLEHQIHPVTTVKRRHFNKLFQHHGPQLLQEVATKATGPRSHFAKVLALTKTAAEDKPQGSATITADMWMHCQIRLSNAESEAMPSSFADTERVTEQMEREIHGITSNEQKQLLKEISIHLSEFETWWEKIGMPVLRKAIEQHMIHFRCRKMHLLSHISESIWWTGSGDNISADISELLHIANVNNAYRSSNKVNQIRQMLKHNFQCNSLDYMEETLSYLALPGRYDIDSANVFNLLSATDKQRSTHGSHLLCRETIQVKPFICPVSKHVYHLREMHICGVCRSIKLTSLSESVSNCSILGHVLLWRSKKTWNRPVGFWFSPNGSLHHVHQYWSANLEFGMWIMQLCMAHHLVVSDFSISSHLRKLLWKYSDFSPKHRVFAPLLAEFWRYRQ